MSTYLNINAIKDGSIPNSKLEENYVVQEEGKQLSTNDFTDTLKSKLESLYNYDDADIQNKIQLLENKLDILFGESGTDAIETFNEIIKFLENIDDSESLDSIIKSIEQQITQKQDAISDLSTIRSNASKGAVAEQNAKTYTNNEINKLSPSIVVNENSIAVKIGSKQSDEIVVPYASYANDLSGRIEATPEVFTYRPSAGNKSIRDDNAIIKRIKGNTIVWNQLFKSPKLDGTYAIPDNTTDEGIVNGMRRIVSTDGTAQTLKIQDTVFPPTAIKEHKYYIAVTINTDGNGVSWTFNGALPEPQVASTPSVKKRYDIISTAINSRRTMPQVRVHNATFMEAANQIFIDLTKMFGAGNEPSTVEEFKALFPNEYYEYNPGEIRSLNIDGIKTTGLNQWDEEWTLGLINISTGELQESQNSGVVASKNYIPVLPDVDYYFKFPANPRIAFYDQNKKFIYCIYTNSKGLVHTPANCHYIRFSVYSSYGKVYKNDICINLSHTGVRNGEYEPYEEHVLSLGELSKYMPLYSVGAVYDEINANEVIKRIGVVKLKDLTWTSPNSDLLSKSVFNAKISDMRPRDDSENETTYRKSILCSKYDIASNTSYDTMDDKSIFRQGAAYGIVIKDTTYTTINDFVASLTDDDVVYYELAEPIIIEIEEPFDLSYTVGDFGTEEIISAYPTAPFKADIIYQFNATDTIRQNKNSIFRNTKKIKELENKLNVTNLTNGNIKVEGLGEFMAATPSGNPNHNLYTSLGAVWSDAGWQLNGVPLTNEEIDVSYLGSLPYLHRIEPSAWGNPNVIFLQKFKTNFYAIIQVPYNSTSKVIDGNSIGYASKALEVVRFQSNINQTTYKTFVKNCSYMFGNCPKLREIKDYLDVSQSTTFYAAFGSRTTSLETIWLIGLKASIDFSGTSVLKKECLLYMIQNAAPTSAITITVHADVYAWASTDAEVQEALTAQPLVTLISA